MRKLTAPLVIAALLVAAAPAAAKPIGYKGKTSSGHKITFRLDHGRIENLLAGIRMACIPIQGGGAPVGGVEVFGFNKGSVPANRHARFKFMAVPAFFWNKVTMSHDLWTKKRPGGVIAGHMRLQYSYLVPKYPIGTFVIYSCAGGAKFNAKPAR